MVKSNWSSINNETETNNYSDKCISVESQTSELSNYTNKASTVQATQQHVGQVNTNNTNVWGEYLSKEHLIEMHFC